MCVSLDETIISVDQIGRKTAGLDPPKRKSNDANKEIDPPGRIATEGISAGQVENESIRHSID